jgi:hypothetical protein
MITSVHPNADRVNNTINSNCLAKKVKPILAERWLGTFLREISSPQLILGMTAAGFGSRLGRLAGGLFARSQGWGSLGLWAGSRGAGLISEAGAFSAASLLSHSATPGHPASGFTDLFASSLVMFSSLGVARGLVGGHSAVRLLGASYAGILGNHLLQQHVLHWEELQSWDKLLPESLAETLTFAAGGHVAGAVMSRSVGPLGRALDFTIEKVERPRLPFDGGLREFVGVPFKISAGDSNQGSEFSRPHFMKPGGGEGSGRPGSTGITGSFLEPTHPGKMNPFEINHPLQFIRRMSDANLGFATRLQQGNMEFLWRVSDSIEPHLEMYLSALNQVAKRIVLDKPRTVCFKLEAEPTKPGFTFVKPSPTEPFVRLDETSATPVTPSSPEALAMAKSLPPIKPSVTAQSGSFFLRAQEILNQGVQRVRQSARSILPPPREQEPTRPVGIGTETRVRTPIKTVKELWDEVTEWIDPLRGMRGKSAREPNRIVEETELKEVFYLPESPLTQKDLNLMRTILIYIPDGKKLRIHDLNGEAVWEIWTEFGEPKFKKISGGEK